MDDERRDDSGLISVICPHCGMSADVPQIQCFEQQQLLSLKCCHCGKYINKDEIDNAYREYFNREDA